MTEVEVGGPDWSHCMRHGDYETAWEISDRVLASRGPCPPSVPRHEQWLWNGMPLDNRHVLIHCYHGLGDTIQFIRYAPLVARRARKVSVWVQPALLPLLRSVPGIHELLPLHDGDPGITRDLDVEIMELPHIFRTTRSTVPCDIPYLQVEPKTGARGPGYNVGVVWSGGDWDPRRAIPFRDIECLSSVPGVSLHVLQHGNARHQAPRNWGLRTGSEDLRHAASIIKALDLVISIDSMPVHLAGALGVPVWTLLHVDHDWRWPEKGSITPWYPTMRLIRQAVDGQWSDVVEEVMTRLHTQAAVSLKVKKGRNPD